ncbi:MAG: rhodanese-like domain-containing protein [Verrucomicrobiota bacterium]
MCALVKEFLLIAALTCVGAALSIGTKRAQAPWALPELGPGEILAIDARSLDPIWVDARSEEAFAEAHIADALHMNEATWETGLFDLMDRWLETPRPIIVYCSDAGCSTSKKIAAQLREALPDAEIYTLNGGWASWQP